ncbi:MAG: hypothetical protein HYW89_01900 [Candidatus Sungiibacteriota bacterium]|uniref:Uncharacterized protein n=1 Tax=Candidatus Sungiibacteriota bacterium TaxID=2750080 RepID=A0A7T5URK1_9BACT|nr:MAG: hypothetical protein HYW89_01900 [Candidatus Sungbacteria bacterium]
MKIAVLLGLLIFGAFQETPVPFVNAGLELKAALPTHPTISNVAAWQSGEDINVRFEYADLAGGMGQAEFWVQCFQVWQQKGLETQTVWPLLRFVLPQDPRHDAEPNGTFAASIPLYYITPRGGWTGERLRCRFFIYGARQEVATSANSSQTVRNSSNILEIELTPTRQREA